MIKNYVKKCVFIYLSFKNLQFTFYSENLEKNKFEILRSTPGATFFTDRNFQKC